MHTLSNNSGSQANDCMELEHELCSLTKKYEAQGFTHHFSLENGSLVCSDDNLVINNPVIEVHENHYYPKRQDIPHGFCLYAITVKNVSGLFKGIFLLPQGLLTRGEVSADVERQLQLQHWYPQIFKFHH